MKTKRPQSRRQMLFALSIGQVIEWYDFFIYGTASALIFGALFFPTADPLVGLLLSFATFGVAFVARPFGGIIFGHMGDRIGRKPTLAITFIIMGVSTAAVGLLPTYETIGIWAPIMLTLLRIIQGLSLGGEFGGAVLMSIEHAKKGERGFFSAWIFAGSPAGVVLSNATFLVLINQFPESMTEWAWRVPFLLSAALVLVGIVVRLKLEESPAFVAVAKNDRTERAPLMSVLKNRKKTVLLVAGSYLSLGAVTYGSVVFGISWAVKSVGFSYADILGIIIFGQIVVFVMMPIFGKIGDRWGIQKVILLGIVGCALVIFPWLWLVGTGNFGLAVLGYILLAFPYAANASVLACFFAEAFETRIGYSGFSLGYQLGTVVGAGLAPMIATALLEATGTIMSVGFYIVTFCVISFICTVCLGRSRAEILASQDTVSEVVA